MRETPTLYKPCYIRVSEGLLFTPGALTMGELYGIMEGYMFNVYSIDTKITNIDGSHNLEKRTAAPLKLHRAVSLATKLEGQGHIIELRKVSQQP